jgi:hypothetical protein
MAMMVPRETWTDERLDDLNKKVDDGFARLDSDIRELRHEVKAQGESLRADLKAQGEVLRGEMKAQGDELRAENAAQSQDLRAEVNELRREMNERLDSLNHTLVGAVVVIAAAFLGSNAF